MTLESANSNLATSLFVRVIMETPPSSSSAELSSPSWIPYQRNFWVDANRKKKASLALWPSFGHDLTIPKCAIIPVQKQRVERTPPECRRAARRKEKRCAFFCRIYRACPRSEEHT